MIVIDLMGEDDLIVTVAPVEDLNEVARREEMRKRALEEILRRAPQPALQIVPQD